MELYYVLKISGSEFYLSGLSLNPGESDSGFIDYVSFDKDIDTCKLNNLYYTFNKAKSLANIIFINTGINLELEKVEVE